MKMLSMKMLAMGLMIGACAASMSGTAEARGCIKGAIVGGIAGHMAGHGMAGAAAGCAIGHHRANKKAAAADRDASADTRK